MKSLRRSLNNKEHGPSPIPPISGPLASLPPLSRPNLKTQPPKKVIRALENYRPKAPQELSFSKGDFFHVVQEPDPSSPWYEAHNPVTGARGLVPKQMFEEFNKANASMRASIATRESSTQSIVIPQSARPAPTSPRLKTYFAVVLHDFQAERPDELDAKSGDNISVVAQSNREWFVAKPIGKLGRPGLIPVSFVELKDPVTGQSIPESDVVGIMERGDIPKVEEWKKAMVAYKAASIPLGVIDDSTVIPVPNSPYMPSPSTNSDKSQPFSAFSEPQPAGPSNKSGFNGSASATNQNSTWNQPSPEVSAEEPSYILLPFGMLSSAEVVSFHFENDEYWFRINAVWQPLDESTLRPVGNARRLVLFRVYDDFYDFQIQLLQTFPVEAGRAPSASTGSTSRVLPYMPGPVEQVDDIVTSLRQEELDQYLGQLCSLVQLGASHILRHELLQGFFSCKPGDVETAYENGESQSSSPSTAADKFSNLSLGQPELGRESDGSDYGYDEPRPSPNEYRQDNNKYQETKPAMKVQPPPLQIPNSGYSTDVRESNQRHSDEGRDGLNSTASLNTSSSRLRSGSVSTNTPISATNPQAAFIKIKIFDRTSDDLIAIRVSPRVSHRQLLEKVQERLGGEISRLNCRNSSNTGFVPIQSDGELRSWLELTDKHVLYAE